METNDASFRAVFIYSKGCKRQLLMSWKDIETLSKFIKNTIKQEVTIINTNLGLDIYYVSPVDMKAFICKSFLLLHAIKGHKETDFNIISLASHQEIKQYLYHAYLHWIKMPLLLKSYLKSFVIQLNRDYLHNITINSLLFSVWYANLKQIRTRIGGQLDRKGIILMDTLQELYLDQNYNPLEKSFIKDALHESHHN